MSPCPAARLRCAQSALNLRHLYYALRHLHPGHFDNEGNPGMALILDQIGLNARNMQDIILVDSALSDYTVEEVYPNPESLQELRVGIPQYPYVTAYIPKGLCVHLNAMLVCSRFILCCGCERALQVETTRLDTRSTQRPLSRPRSKWPNTRPPK